MEVIENMGEFVTRTNLQCERFEEKTHATA